MRSPRRRGVKEFEGREEIKKRPRDRGKRREDGSKGGKGGGRTERGREW